MVRLVAMVCALALTAGSVAAATLTPDLTARNSARSEALRDGDFDGDGRLDDLYLVTEDTGRVAVRIRLTGTGSDVRVTSVETAANMPLNLQVVAAGTFHSDCGNFASDCTGAIETRHDSLVLTLDGGTAVLMHWLNGRFEKDFVRKDEAMTALSLADMLAHNP